MNNRFWEEVLAGLSLILLALALLFHMNEARASPAWEDEDSLALRSTGMKWAESAWQASHALDVAQTLKGPASDSCFAETDPLTSAIVGRHPSKAAVLGWGVGYGLGHWAITSYLDRAAPAWVAWAWQAITISYAVGYNVHNYQIGIRIGGHNERAPGWQSTAQGCRAPDGTYVF